MPYTPTEKQGVAWKLLREGPRHILLVGGSRSGKTTVIIEEVLCRAVRYPGSRHLIARLRFNHAKSSLWLDTIPKVLEFEGIKREQLKINESDHYIVLPNKSEIWIDGLDDKDRVEKILGREYSTVHFNEVSQIPYNTILLVLTRLAQKVTDQYGNLCGNKAYYDLNPVGRAHWAHKLFIEKMEPVDLIPLKNPSDYSTLTLNPDDNVDHLPSGYIEDVLDRLPEHKRKRFRHGEWGDPEGVIFTNWDIVDVIPEKVIRHSKKSYGLDFGFSINPAAFVKLNLLGKDLYIDELIYETGLTNPSLAKEIKNCNPTDLIYADSAEPKSIKELQLAGVQVKGAAKGPDSIRQGIDWLLEKNLHVTRRSANIQLELMNYEWKKDRNERSLLKPIDDYDHGMDAIRYGSEAFMREKKVAGSLLKRSYG
jgi:phage terminase large subunit